MTTQKNYFPTSNEIFSLELSPGEFAVYSYLLRCEDRHTHQCWPSYRTIGMATSMCVNTVRKHIYAHADKDFISTEDISVFTRDGLIRNGTLRYTLQLFQEVLDAHRQSQLENLELATIRWEHAKTTSL